MGAIDPARSEAVRGDTSVGSDLPMDVTLPQTSQAILVLGMHRSGTSAVTRVLNLLGASLGARLMAPVPGDNEKGYWENQDAVDIDERLLSGIGRSWHDVRDMPHGWEQSAAASDAYAAMTRLVEVEFATAKLWAVKDPRMCRLAPLWLRALADCGVQPGILFVVRHPLEVAASLYVRNGWSRARSLLLWTHHVIEAERATRGCPRVMVTYDQILADWRGTVSRAARVLGVTWFRSFEEARAEVEAFLDVSQRHHQTSAAQADAAAASGDLPSLVAEVYQQCVELSGDQGGWRHFQELGDEFARPAALYGACFDDLVGYAPTSETNTERSGSMPAESLPEADTLRQVSERLTLRVSTSDRGNLEAINQSLSQQAALLERLTRLVAEQLARIDSLEAAVASESETLRFVLAIQSQATNPPPTEPFPPVSEHLEKLRRRLAAQADAIGGIERELAKVRRGQIVPRLQRWLRRSDA